MNNISTSEYVLNSFKQYAIYVCETRSIPKVTDGLKSSQRKALWVARGKKDKIKTISLAGEMISRGLYVHGDSSASQAISLMAAPFCNNITYFTGYGAFGTRVNPYGFGAPRYTYVKVNPVAEKLLFVDNEIIPMTENYDGSTVEPSTFIPLVPLVLLNGISGIAVGWSTEILRHNIKDIIDATIYVLQGKKIENLKPYYEHYDIDIVEEEPLKYVFIGKIEIVNSTTIKVKSLPPDLSLEKFKEHLNDLINSGKIKDYEDVSTENIEIFIKTSREFIKNNSEEKIIDMLKLKTRKTERLVVIDFDGNTIKQYDSHNELIEKFIEWRIRFYYDRYYLKMKQYEERLNFLKYIKILHEKNFVSYCGKAKNKEEIVTKVKNLCKNIDGETIEKIINIPVYRWTKEEYEKIVKEIEDIEKEIENCKKTIETEENVRKKYLEELKDLRRTFE